MDAAQSRPRTLSGPRLPPELECTIFEIAALSRPTSIPQLALIARRVKHWVEPLLYRVIFISKYTNNIRSKSGLPALQAQTFLEKIANKPPDFIRSSVRHLFLDGSRTTDAAAILKACNRVTNLFVEWNTNYPDPHMLGALECLQRLTIDIVWLFKSSDIIFSHPLFRNITHLELLDDYNEGPRMDVLCSGLALVPHLTHIAFNATPIKPELGGIGVLHAGLRADTRLVCIVFLCSDTQQMKHARGLLDDERFVCIDQNGYRWDWIRGARTGEDYWALADAFIAAKRAGRVNRSWYHISYDDDSWRT